MSEGDSKTARLMGELEQELKASSYVVIRVPKLAFEPETIMKALQDAQASRGVLLSDDGKTVMVLAAAPGGGTLRVYAEYSLNHENRLARRRQWIALVERLRVSMEEDHSDDGGQSSADEPVSKANMPQWRNTTMAPSDLADPVRLPPIEQPYDGLGAAVALGYITGGTGLTSHLLLSGHHHLTRRISLLAQVLWPMVQGERSSPGTHATAQNDDATHSRVWSFIGAFGLMAEPAPPAARVTPYMGLTTGLQFLLAYVDRPSQAITEIHQLASMVVDGQLGLRTRVHAGTWLVVQLSSGRAISLSDHSDPMTKSLADTWAFRAAVGLLMSL